MDIGDKTAFGRNVTNNTVYVTPTNDTWIHRQNDGETQFVTENLSIFSLVIIGTFLAIIIFLSAAGNILVCIAIYTERSLRRIGNLFLASLAVADLFVSVLVMTFASVNDILGYWIFGDFCDTWIGLDIWCSTASILNLCAISLDRYIHIRDPLRYTRWVTRYVAIATIVVIWLLAALISFVPISLGLHRPDQSNIYIDTKIYDESDHQICALELTPTYAVVSSCISFYVPCIIMISIYCRLYCYAQKHVKSIRAVTKTGEYNGNKTHRSLRRVKQPKKLLIRYPNQSAYNASDHKAAITVGIIMGVFLLCWLPFFCINIVAAFCQTCIDDQTFKILTWLGYSNSAFNPIIYSIFNKEFRVAFKRILRSRKLCCCCSQSSEYLGRNSNDKYITNYDGRHMLNSQTDVEQLSAI